MGAREVALMTRELAPSESDRVLDVGSGTGYFTRALSRWTTVAPVALDSNLDWLAWSASEGRTTAPHVAADATALPFRDDAFDLTMSVTSLCFVDRQRRAVEEIIRVTRRRFAIGVLNRRSLLWRSAHDSPGYAGAHWHTVSELRGLLANLPVHQVRFRSAIHLPSGSIVARCVERLIPSRAPVGGFLLVVGEVRR
jgi:SAM-dependent methyltransferase